MLRSINTVAIAAVLALDCGSALTQSTNGTTDNKTTSVTPQNSATNSANNSGVAKGSDAKRPTDAECAGGWTAQMEWTQDDFKKYCSR